MSCFETNVKVLSTDIVILSVEIIAPTILTINSNNLPQYFEKQDFLNNISTTNCPYSPILTVSNVASYYAYTSPIEARTRGHVG